MDDVFDKLGLFSETEIDALVKIAGSIPDTLIKGGPEEGESPPRSRRDAARTILNYASRHSAGTTICIDGKELGAKQQRTILKSIKNNSESLSRSIKKIWVRDNWNLSCHFEKRGIRKEYERLIYLLDNTHHAAESALQDLQPIKKKGELTNASKTERAKFMSALFNVWENIFEQKVSLARTSATKASKGGRPSGKLVKFIVEASKMANVRPEVNPWTAEAEIKKRKKPKTDTK